MMYSAGWGNKDSKQKRLLAIDLSLEGFLWALQNSCLSSFKSDIFETKEEWEKQKEISPVRIQWDSERDISLNKLNYRTIQIGLAGDAVQHYTREWIIKINDITNLASQIKSKIDLGDINHARELLPEEKPYSLTSNLARKIGIIATE
jgi:hypothetical protein